MILRRLAPAMTVIGAAMVFAALAVGARDARPPLLVARGSDILAYEHGLTARVSHTVHDNYPSPDGAHVIEVPTSQQLYLDERLLLAGPSVATVTWSPDSARAAVVATTGGAYRLFMVDSAANDVALLARFADFVQVLWADDGAWFAVVESATRNNRPSLHMGTGGGLTRLTNRLKARTSVAWRPGHSALTYVDVEGVMHFVDAETGITTTLQTDVVDSALWSPSGDHLLLNFIGAEIIAPALWTAGAITPLNEHAGVVEGTSGVMTIPGSVTPRWSADGRWLAFGVFQLSAQRGIVQVFDVGDGPPHLAHTFDTRYPPRKLRFSADGQYMAAQSIVAPDAGEVARLNLLTGHVEPVDLGGFLLEGVGLP